MPNERTTKKRKVDGTVTTVTTTRAKPKASKKDVQKALLGLSETKVYRASNSRVLQNTYQYWLNPLYWISVGTGDSNRIGDQIFITNIDVRFKFDSANPTSAGDSDRHGCVMLVKATEEYHQGTIDDAGWNTLGLPDIRYGGIGNVSNPIVDDRVFTVVWKKKFMLPMKNYASTSTYKSIVFDKTFKINKNFQYRSTSNGYSKTNNYYLYCGLDSQLHGGIPTDTAVGYADIAVMFKDM